MKLEKTYHTILGCEVWSLSQTYIDASGQHEMAKTKHAFMPHELDYRDHVAWRLRGMRAALREFIARDSK